MGAVAIVIAWRGEFPRALGFDASIAAPRCIEVLRADQFLVAVRSVELLTRGAFAMPAWNLMIT